MFSQYVAHTVTNRHHVRIRLREREEDRDIAFTAHEDELKGMINDYIAPWEEPVERSFFVRIVFEDEQGSKAESDAEVFVYFKGVEITPEKQVYPSISFRADGEYSVKIDPINRLYPDFTLVAYPDEFEQKLREYIPLVRGKDSLINVLYLHYNTKKGMYQPLDLWVHIYFNGSDTPSVEVEAAANQRILDFRAFITDLCRDGVFNGL